MNNKKILLSDKEIYQVIIERRLNKSSYTKAYRDIVGKAYSEDEARKRLKGLEEVTKERLESNFIDKSGIGIKPRLVISDLHLPFAVDNWLDFIKETHSKYNCHEEIILNGDAIDFHAASFHTPETDSDNLNDEFDKAYKMIQALINEFPRIIFLIGNHDARISRKNKELGIHERFLKTFHQLFDLPKTVKVMEEIIIDNVYYRHIGCAGGKDGAINSAVSNRMSTVVSHLHTNGGCKYVTSPNGEMIFGLNTGCLMDDDSYAARYGKFARYKGTLGCGVVYSDKEAYFIPNIKE